MTSANSILLIQTLHSLVSIIGEISQWCQSTVALLSCCRYQPIEIENPPKTKRYHPSLTCHPIENHKKNCYKKQERVLNLWQGFIEKRFEERKEEGKRKREREWEWGGLWPMASCPPFEFSSKYYQVSDGGGCVRQSSFFQGKAVLNQGVGYSVILGFGAFFAVFTSFLVNFTGTPCLDFLFFIFYFLFFIFRCFWLIPMW